MNRTKIYLPEYGYCQGMGVLVSYLLLIMEEEYVFYCCLFILNKLPDNYFSPDLKGLRAEQGRVSSLKKIKILRMVRVLTGSKKIFSKFLRLGFSRGPRNVFKIFMLRVFTRLRKIFNFLSQSKKLKIFLGRVKTLTIKI